MCFLGWCGEPKCQDEHDDDDSISTSKLTRVKYMERSLRERLRKSNARERQLWVKKVEDMNERLMLANRARLDEIRMRNKLQKDSARRLAMALEQVERMEADMLLMKKVMAKEERRRKKKLAKKKAREPTPEIEEPPTAPNSSDVEKSAETEKEE